MHIQFVSFGARRKHSYNSQLKTLYKEGKLPTVVHGFYGGMLNKDNVSIEHIVPVADGGSVDDLANIALATKWRNQIRNRRSIKKTVAPEVIQRYLRQFEGIRVKGFNGDFYIKIIKKTLKNKCGINLF